ncbi:hypothetical protein GW17_00059913, partial [Ensete ventricosum]
RRRVAGATPFSCRGGLWWEQATDDADNGSSLTVGAGVIDNDAKAIVISGIAERGSEIGKVVNRVLEKQKKSSGNGRKSCMEKTKALAVLGFNKAEGSSKGFHWIKDKHRKRAQKN